MVNNPSLILADEPTGNLDSVSGAEIISMFHHLNQEEGITVIIITHEAEIASQAQRIIRLQDGRIIDQ